VPTWKPELAAVPPTIRAALARLQSRGRAWLVGGTVRDLMLGLSPTDYDVATDIAPEQVRALLPGADLRDAKLGAVRVPGLGAPMVATTLRGEADYRDHRHPACVWFVDDPAVDARRRDFTVNALYADPVAGVLLDPTGGLDDLGRRTLRAIGEPAVRFDEDALRLLRLLRFAAGRSLAIEAATASAARAAAPLLAHLSAERVYDELTRAFTGPNRGAALRLFVDLGFADVLLPEVAAMEGVTQPPEFHPEGCVLTHCCLVLDHVPAGDPLLSWTAVLHDVGKPPTWRRAADRIRFDGHDVLSARMAEDVLLRFGAPRELRTAVAELCRDHIRFAALPQMRPRRRERWLRSPLFGKHLEFHRADCLGSHGKLSLYETARQALASLPPERPELLTGADVLALGVPEGPLVGRLLRAATDALDLLPHADASRERALELLRDLVLRTVKPTP
jgi:poly(A) polymerase